MCDSQDIEFPSVHSDEWRRARKAHKCCACYEDIPIGDRYHYTFAVFDGPESYRHCVRCWMMFDAIVKVRGVAQYDLNCGVLWESEFGSGPPPEHVAALAFMTREEAQNTLPAWPEGR